MLLLLCVLGGVLHVAGGSTNGYSVERYSVPDDSWEMVRGMKEERSFFYAVTMSRAMEIRAEIPARVYNEAYEELDISLF
jgi:hypothetical protein